MANLRDIRNRIESINNTQQITKAMKMVAAAKLRKAQNRIIETRPYAHKLKSVVARLVENAEQSNPLFEQRDKVEKVLFIVISSDRGLCGAFNNNLFKVVEKRIDEEFESYHQADNLSMVCIGRKGSEYFGKRSYMIEQAHRGFFDDLHFAKASEIMQNVIGLYTAGEFDRVYLAYNEFKSVIAQTRCIEALLPIDPRKLLDGEEANERFIDYIYEPDVESILECLLPLHLNMQLWKAILESNAAEQGARMTAMDNATENAKELQRDLRLKYNQARQSAITTEISEIVSGAQALEEA